MEISLRDLLTVLYGMGFGALFMLAFSGALAELFRMSAPGAPAVPTVGPAASPYSSGMIYLKLRHLGLTVNHKRVERLYTDGKLQVHRRQRKNVPVSDRQPLGQPSAANQV